MPSLVENEDRAKELAREVKAVHARAKVDALKDYRQLKAEDQNAINARIASEVRDTIGSHQKR